MTIKLTTSYSALLSPPAQFKSTATPESVTNHINFALLRLSLANNPTISSQQECPQNSWKSIVIGSCKDIQFPNEKTSGLVEPEDPGANGSWIGNSISTQGKTKRPTGTEDRSATVNL